MTLRQLRSAVAVSDTGGFSAAALRLGRTQPAVSRSVAELEARLDTPLFTRLKSKCRPTTAGDILIARARRAFDILRTISGRVAETASNRELEAAIAIARAGTLSAASRHLGLSQPALSQAVAGLEARLERPLFIRMAASVQPAPGSTAIIQAMGLALAEIEQGLEEIRFLAGKTDGRLSIGALPLARPMLLPRVIDAVLDCYPDANISIAGGSYDALETGLRSGEIDAIVGSLRGGSAVRVKDLDSRLLFTDGMAIVASRGHPLAYRSPPAMEDLLDNDWVLPPRGVPLREEFQSIISAAGLSPPLRVLETNSMTVVKSLLGSRPRLAVVSDHQVSGDLKQGVLMRIPMPMSVKRRPVGVTIRAGARHTPLLAAFLATLEAVASPVGLQAAMTCDERQRPTKK